VSSPPPAVHTLSAAVSARNVGSIGNRAEIARQQDLIRDLEISILAERAKPAEEKNESFIEQAQGSVASLKIELARQNLQPNFDRHFDQSQQVQAVQVAANNLINSLRANTKCVANKPGIAGQVLGSVFGIASSFFPGLLGGVLSGASSVVDNLFTYIQENKSNKFVSALRSSNLATAIGCTYEGLATTYCQSRDMRNAISNLKAHNEPIHCSPEVHGARIAGREIVSLMNWVQQLSLLQSSPVDAQAASLLNGNREVMRNGLAARIYEAREDLRKGKNQKVVLGKLLAAMKLAIQTGDGTGKAVAGESSYYGGDSDFRDYNGTFFRYPQYCGIFKFLYTGGERGMPGDTDIIGEPVNGEGPYSKDGCVALFQGAGYKEPTLETFQAAANKYLDSLSGFVNQQLSSIQADDPDTVLAQAEQKDTRRGIPIEILKGIKGYLSSTRAELDVNVRSDRHLDKSMENLQVKVEKAIEVYSDPSFADGKAKAKAIYDVFERENYARFSTSLWQLVKTDMERRAAKKDPDSDAMLFELSNLGTAQEMLKYLGYTDKETAGTWAAQYSSKKSISAFDSLFKEQFLQSLKGLKQDRSQTGKQNLGIMCMRALIVPGANSDPTITQACGGSQYVGDTLKPLSFNDYVGRPYESRVCAIYDYFRKSQLASQIHFREPTGSMMQDAMGRVPVVANDESREETQIAPSPPIGDEEAALDPPSAADSSQQNESVCSKIQLKRGCAARSQGSSEQKCVCPNPKSEKERAFDPFNGN